MTRGAPTRGSTAKNPVVVLIVVGLMFVVPGVIYAWNSVQLVSAEIEGSRLRLAQLASAEADRIVAEAYFELEVVAQLIDPSSNDGGTAPIELAPSIWRRVTSFHSAILVIDPAGHILAERPVGSLGAARLRQVAGEVDSEDRSVSEPWTDPVSGHVVIGFGVPMFQDDGTKAGSVVGIVDLTEPLISDLVMPAARLGLTGHADLVDERGLVLASTEASHVMTQGDHPDFYENAGAERLPVVENVPHKSDIETLDRPAHHVMAYAPLRNAPWGVAMGASEEETLAVVRHLRSRLVIAGAAGAAVLALGIWFVARDLQECGPREDLLSRHSR